MKGKHHQKQVNPDRMIMTVTDIFNPVLNKPALKNLILIIVAITSADTLRGCELARHLPTDAKRDNAKKTRLLRFLAREYPLDEVMKRWLAFVLEQVCQKRKKYTSILRDETKLIGGYKAIVAAIPFRERAIPIFGFIYSDAEIKEMKHKSHNQVIADFCTTVYQLTSSALPDGCAPLLIFDRGFARARHVIKFLNEKRIGFLMRVDKNVGIEVNGVPKTLRDMTSTTFYPQIVYHRTERIEMALSTLIDKQFDDPVHLISNTLCCAHDIGCKNPSTHAS